MDLAISMQSGDVVGSIVTLRSSLENIEQPLLHTPLNDNEKTENYLQFSQVNLEAMENGITSESSGNFYDALLELETLVNRMPKSDDEQTSEIFTKEQGTCSFSEKPNICFDEPETSITEGTNVDAEDPNALNYCINKPEIEGNMIMAEVDNELDTCQKLKSPKLLSEMQSGELLEMMCSVNLKLQNVQDNPRVEILLRASLDRLNEEWKKGETRKRKGDILEADVAKKARVDNDAEQEASFAAKTEVNDHDLDNVLDWAIAMEKSVNITQ